MPLLDDVRDAIDTSDLSRYSLSKRTGIDQGHLSKFMAGTVGLSIERLEVLAEALGLEIVIRPRRARKD